jgi:hypothetical protein|tara:strand:+ start:303 stop:524 length:222 start_codon:yes stop_codon:yes gene_type:complete
MSSRSKIPLHDFKQQFSLTQGEIGNMFHFSQGAISEMLRTTSNGTRRCSVKRVGKKWELYEEKTIGVGSLPWM